MTFRNIRNAMVLAGLAVVSVSAPAWAVPLPGPGGIAIGGLIALGVGAAILLGRRKK